MKRTKSENISCGPAKTKAIALKITSTFNLQDRGEEEEEEVC